MGKQHKIIGYCRLSLEEKDQGSSLASQRSEISGTTGDFIEEHPRQFLSTWVDQVLVTKGSRHEPIADRIEIILKPIQDHPWADVFRVNA